MSTSCRRILVTVVSISFVWVGTTNLSRAAQAKPEKSTVRIGYASQSGAFAALWIAAQKGHFSAEGLNAEILFTRTVTGVQAMISGEVDFVATGCPELFRAKRQGFDLRVVGDFAPVNVYLIASRKEITDPNQLKGKRVGVNQFLDTSHVSARFALRHVGVDPDSVTFIQVGSTPERFAALRAGTIDGAVQAALFKPVLAQQGLNNLISLYDMKIPYCSGGLGVGTETLKKFPRLAEATLRAVVRGHAFLGKGPEDQSKAIIARYMRLPITDPRLAASYNFFAKDAYFGAPKITTEATKTTLEMMGETDLSWKKEKAEAFIDTSIMSRLESEGFIDAVYKEFQGK
jgi:ABC-type nitrate/sulfonate/bicarbonate transport system substrate-binding protein